MAADANNGYSLFAANGSEGNNGGYSQSDGGATGMLGGLRTAYSDAAVKSEEQYESRNSESDSNDHIEAGMRKLRRDVEEIKRTQKQLFRMTSEIRDMMRHLIRSTGVQQISVQEAGLVSALDCPPVGSEVEENCTDSTYLTHAPDCEMPFANNLTTLPGGRPHTKINYPFQVETEEDEIMNKKTIEDLRTLNAELKDSEFFTKAFVELQRHTCAEVGPTTRSVMNNIASPHVWCKYNFRGQRQKTGLVVDVPNVYKLIKAVVLDSHKRETVLVFENLVKNYLKSCIHSVKRKKSLQSSSDEKCANTSGHRGDLSEGDMSDPQLYLHVQQHFTEATRNCQQKMTIGNPTGD